MCHKCFLFKSHTICNPVEANDGDGRMTAIKWRPDLFALPVERSLLQARWLVVTSTLGGYHVPCYIDDRHVGQFSFSTAPYPALPENEARNLAAAKSAIFFVKRTLIGLSYFVNLAKSILFPWPTVPYLGFLCDPMRSICSITQ